jgi:hypothetical protein
MSRFAILAGLPALLLVQPLGAAEVVPSYHRHISALLARLGCNGGTCHGAVQGQNGFKLSLFGADPAADHERLIREFGGRRLDLHSPASSLILRKATGQAPHMGGARTRVGSAEYEVLRRWIAAGAPLDAPAPIKSLSVTPAERVAKPGEKYRLRVEACFADGTKEDVTAYCSFEARDPALAKVAPSGEVTALAVGDAALVVRYRGHPAMSRVLVPRPGKDITAGTQPNNFIDRHVLAKLRQLNLPSAPLADDATFLRRACLDVAGELPTPDEVRAFMADKRPDKRRRKIDELLARPGHAALWTLRFCDLLKAADYGVYADALTQEADAPRFQAWVRARLEENVPYDQFVERILLATSREGRDMKAYAGELREMFEGYAPGRPDLEKYRGRKTLDLYWQRRGSVGVGGAMQVAHAFLGLRLECAQCHRHPHDVWQQDDLLDFANFFTRVRQVGFQGENEKRFPEAGAMFKQINTEAKKAEGDAKKLREALGRTFDAELQKARQMANRLEVELRKGEDAKKRQELDGLRQKIARDEARKKEADEMQRRAKLLPEVARRLLQAEVVILPPGKFARVSSPLGTKESKALRLLGQTEAVTVDGGKDPRELVMAWMRKPDNPFFARSIVNRVWAHYFGRGLIDPPDNLSPLNPATHPELLRELSDGFVKSGYDLRWLHRTILHSRTYQQSSVAPEESAADRANYAAFPVRRLPAEVVIDALDRATGTTEKLDMKYYHWPEHLRAIEMPYAPRNAFVGFALETFGRPKRNAAVQCDCEREAGVSILQVLALANHPRVWEKIRDKDGLAARLLKEKTDNGGRVDELFLAVLGRVPSGDEKDACVAFIKDARSPEEGVQGVLWGLINTREFLLQH